MNLIGLENINNICYLNSIIQALYSCDIHHKYNPGISKVGLLLQTICNKFDNNIIDIDENIQIHKELKFTGQNCLYDALLSLVSSLNLENIFSIEQSKVMLCTSCSRTKKIKSDMSIVFNYFINESFIHKALYGQIEELDSNTYKCDFCNSMEKKLLINKLVNSSDIFVILFNPYIFNQKIWAVYKLNIEGKKYILKSKIIYNGNADSGHYWVIRYHDDKIYKINDNVITQLHQDIINGVYMLFYLKV